MALVGTVPQTSVERNTLARRGADALEASVVWSLPVGLAVVMTHVSGIGCPFRAVTGLDCPACGATRAVTNVMHGRLAEALHYNGLLICLGFPLVAILLIEKLDGRNRRLLPGWLSRHLGRYLCIVAVLWTVVRNLPALSWLNTDWRTA